MSAKIEVNFHNMDKENYKLLKFAVIVSKFQDKWVFVRHKDRNTWEIPGGHKEIGETIDETAKRELFEETGAKKFQIKPVCNYSVTRNNIPSYGRLFFSKIEELGILPDYEIKEVQLFDEIPHDLTYPEIQPYLFKKVRDLDISNSTLDISKICPICGQDNNCQSHDKECWCYYINIPKGLLDLIPEDKRGKACICKSCIEKYKGENN